MIFLDVFFNSLFFFLLIDGVNSDQSSILVTKKIEDFILDYEDDMNSMVAVTEQDEPVTYEDFYEETDSREQNDALGIIYYGSTASFLRLDAESVLHILINTKKNLMPLNRVLLAWDMITDGLTPAFLQGREYVAFGSLLNYVPEEDLYYVNFGDSSVLRHFAFNAPNLDTRKYGILASAYKRYFGDIWYTNSSYINELGYILCGFPASDLARIEPKTFTSINIDVISKLRRCSSKQTQVLYNIARHPQAYGAPYDWTSHEIMRLEYLFTCIDKEDISSINLEAINAISPVVMDTLDMRKLEQFTHQQILRMNTKARRIYILRMQLKHTVHFYKLTNFTGNVQRMFVIEYQILIIILMLVLH